MNFFFPCVPMRLAVMIVLLWLANHAVADLSATQVPAMHSIVFKLEELDITRNTMSAEVVLDSGSGQRLLGHFTHASKEVYWDWNHADWNAWSDAVGVVPLLMDCEKSSNSGNTTTGFRFRQVLDYRYGDQLYSVTNWSNNSITDNRSSCEKNLFSAIASAFLVLVPSADRTEGVNLVGGGDQFATFKILFDSEACGGAQLHIETRNLEIPFDRDGLLASLFWKQSSVLAMERIRTRSVNSTPIAGDYCSFTTLTASIEYGSFTTNQIGILEYRDLSSSNETPEGMRILWEPNPSFPTNPLFGNSMLQFDKTNRQNNIRKLAVDGFQMLVFRDGEPFSMSATNPNAENYFDSIVIGEIVLNQIAFSIPFGHFLYDYPNFTGFGRIQHKNFNLVFFEANWGVEEYSRRVVDIWGKSSSLRTKLYDLFKTLRDNWS